MDSEDSNDEDTMKEPPPKLPHLPVRHFFRDLVVRVAQDFTDASGGTHCEGTVITLLRSDKKEDGTFLLMPLSGRSIRLNPQQHAEIIENAGNAWLQPVPNANSLHELCYWVDNELTAAEEEADEESEEHLETLIADFQLCQEWLDERHGKPPKPSSAALAVTVFGRDHPATYWIRLLFAAVAVTSDD